MLQKLRYQSKAFLKNITFLIRETLRGSKVERECKLQNSKQVIVLVYGFSLSRRAMSIMERRFRLDGYDVISLDIGSIFNIYKTGDIRLRAAILRDKINQLRLKYNIGSFVLIGHSEGSVVGRYYVQFMGGDKYCSKLISLAGPHNGCKIAWLGVMTMGLICKDVWQMLPDSGLVEEFRSKKFPSSCKFYSLYSPDDWVCDVEDCVTDAINVEIKGVGHNEFLFSRKVYRLIRKLIKKEI